MPESYIRFHDLFSTTHMELEIQNPDMKLQQSAIDSLIVSNNHSIACPSCVPLFICCFKCWDRLSSLSACSSDGVFGNWSRLVWVLVFNLTANSAPYRSLVLPTASLNESLDHSSFFTTTRSDHHRKKKQSFSKNQPLV